MAITVPAKLAILGPGAMVAAPISGPLQTILDNTNHLYWRHRPAWVSHAVSGDASAATLEYVIPVPIASVDVLRYAWRIVLQAGAVGTVTVAIAETNTYDTATAVWSTITTSAAFALINGFAVLSTSQPVSADTTMIRVKLTAATTAVRVCHVYAAPDPSNSGAPFASGGITTSNFVVADDGLLGTAGNPVTQELVNRCSSNSIAVLQDRSQVVASLLCPLDRTGVTLKAPQTWVSAPGGSVGGWVLVGRTRARLPSAIGPQVLNVRAIASLTGGGSTADLVEIQVQGTGKPQSTLFAADAVAGIGFVTVEPDPDGWLEIRVRVRAWAGQSVYVHAVTVDWQPLQAVAPSQLITGTGYRTPASAALLSTAAKLVMSRAMMEYCAVGHMVDCASTSGRYTMQAHISVPRGTAGLRLWNLRVTDFSATATTATDLAGSTDGTIATPADSIQPAGTLTGADVYLDVTAAGTTKAHEQITDTKFDATPAGLGHIDRQLVVTEDLVTSIELVQITRSCAWCLFPGRKTADLSVL